MNLLGLLFTISLLTNHLVLFAAARTVFAHRLDVVQGRIVGGSAAAPHSHPYMISLQLRFLWARAHFCGGSLLNQNWVLSAGHCITESWLIRLLNVDAVAGATDVDSWDSHVQVEKIVQRIEHPNYEGGIGPNDIAMLKTERPFVFTNQVQPIALPAEDIDLGQGAMILAGWGVLRTTTFIPDTPSLLQELKVTYVPYDKCYETINKFADSEGTNPLEASANICTGPLSGGKAACNGDSGGPLILDEYTSREVNGTESSTIPESEDDDDYWNIDWYDYIWSRDKVTTSNASDTDTPITESSTDSTDSYSASPETVLAEVSEEASTDISTSTISTLSETIPRKRYLVGVVSWGISPCGEAGAPTVYTGVSKYLDFIKSYINT